MASRLSDGRLRGSRTTAAVVLYNIQYHYTVSCGGVYGSFRKADGSGVVVNNARALSPPQFERRYYTHLLYYKHHI